MKVEFWLVKGEDKFILPVTPSEFNLQTYNNNQTVTVNSLGEVNIPGKGKLAQISFGSFFPVYSEIFSPTTISKPLDYNNKLIGWKELNEPIRLLITGININLNVLIEEYDYGYHPGNEDIYYTIVLKEYRQVTYTSTGGGVQSTQAVAASTGNEPRTNSTSTASTQTTYTVVSGDCLWNIAKRFYGDGSQYNKIAEANNIQNPDVIYDGDTLVIPS